MGSGHHCSDGNAMVWTGALPTRGGGGGRGHAGSTSSVVVQGESSMGSPRKAWEEKNKKGIARHGIHFSTSSYKKPELKICEQEPKSDL